MWKNSEIDNAPMTSLFLANVEAQIVVLQGLRGLDADVTRAGERIAATLRSGGKLLICGNGGSAADAQHISRN